MLFLLCKWRLPTYLISIFTVLLVNNFVLNLKVENLFKINELVYFSTSANFIMVNFWFTHVIFVYLIVLIALLTVFKLLYW